MGSCCPRPCFWFFFSRSRRQTTRCLISIFVLCLFIFLVVYSVVQIGIVIEFILSIDLFDSRTESNHCSWEHHFVHDFIFFLIKDNLASWWVEWSQDYGLWWDIFEAWILRGAKHLLGEGICWHYFVFAINDNISFSLVIILKFCYNAFFLLFSKDIDMLSFTPCHPFVF
jgi:hypothetical protein